MKSEDVKTVWQGLTGGLEEIYNRYSAATAQRNKEHRQALDRAKTQYQAEKNAVAAAQHLQKQNTDQTLAAHGLGRSGESLTAQLNQGLARAAADSQAADRYQSSVQELEKQNAQAQLAQDKQLHQEVRDQLSDQHEQLSAQRQQDLEEKKLALEEKKLEHQIRQEDKKADDSWKELIQGYEDDIAALEDSISRYEALLEMKKPVPDKTPSQLFESILSENRKYQSGSAPLDGLDPVYKDKVAQAVNKVLEDSDLDDDYRKTLEIYARVAGFLE